MLVNRQLPSGGTSITSKHSAGTNLGLDAEDVNAHDGILSSSGNESSTRARLPELAGVEGAGRTDVDLCGPPPAGVEGAGCTDVDLCGPPLAGVEGAGLTDVDLCGPLSAGIEGAGRTDVDVCGPPLAGVEGAGCIDADLWGPPPVEGAGRTDVDLCGPPPAGVEGAGRTVVDLCSPSAAGVEGVGRTDVDLCGPTLAGVEGAGRPGVKVLNDVCWPPGSETPMASNFNPMFSNFFIACKGHERHFGCLDDRKRLTIIVSALGYGGNLLLQQNKSGIFVALRISLMS